MNFEPDFIRKAREKFSVSLYPWQQLVISNILTGYETHCKTVSDSFNEEINSEILYDEDGCSRAREIVLLPTGAGKSLCFQVPSLILPGATLVIYPLLALMADQKRRLDSCGIDSVVLRGGQSIEERNMIFKKIDSGIKFIIANPEILSSGKILTELKKSNITHLVIDEAHCCTQWGDTFRPSYLELTKIVEFLDPPVVTAFTATASPTVLNRINEIIFKGDAHIVRGDGDRTNLFFEVIKTESKDTSLVLQILKNKRPAVVFCNSRSGTEKTAKMLRRILGEDDIKFYHAGMEKQEKTDTEKWFHDNPYGILVCTCAWGMGVDKSDIKTVIHYNFPSTQEAYMQEAGRGGRDGSISKAILLWSSRDEEKLIQVKNEYITSPANFFKAYVSGDYCRRKILLCALGENNFLLKGKPTKINNLEKYKINPSMITIMDFIASQHSPEYFSCEIPSEDSYPDLKYEEKNSICSGCDVCFGSKAGMSDSEIVYNFVKKNNRRFNYELLVNNLLKSFNSETLKKYKIKIWEPENIKLILDSLLRQGRISLTKFLPEKSRVIIN